MEKIKPNMTRTKDNDIHYKIGRILHREDGPALITSNGLEVWFFNGLIHREDGPAIKCSTANLGVYSSPNYWLNGKCHFLSGRRSLGDQKCGFKAWYLNGVVHRVGGPAIEYDNGSFEYTINNRHHRENEVCLQDVKNNCLYYCLNGNFHREDGPAIMYLNKDKEDMFYIKGKKVSENVVMKKKIVKFLRDK